MGRFTILLLEDLSERIRSRDRKTWPLRRGGRCGEVAVGGGSTVLVTLLIFETFTQADLLLPT